MFLSYLLLYVYNRSPKKQDAGSDTIRHQPPWPTWWSMQMCVSRRRGPMAPCSSRRHVAWSISCPLLWQETQLIVEGPRDTQRQLTFYQLAAAHLHEKSRMKMHAIGRGRGATRSRGVSWPPLFQVRGPHMDVDPPLFVRITWCMNAADNTFKLSDL